MTITLDPQPYLSPAPSTAVPSVANARTPTCCQLIRSVNAWAARHGYAGGYPTFACSEQDGRVSYQAVLFRPGTAKLVDVSHALLSRLVGSPLSDYEDQQQMLADIGERLNRWSWAKGYGGALFGAQVARDSGSERAYRALLITIPDVPQLRWTLDELDHPESLEALFQAVHHQARAAGHLSGFPSFAWNGSALNCVMVDDPSVKLIEIPAAELR
jgi:hypothetical protein